MFNGPRVCECEHMDDRTHSGLVHDHATFSRAVKVPNCAGRVRSSAVVRGARRGYLPVRAYPPKEVELAGHRSGTW